MFGKKKEVKQPQEEVKTATENMNVGKEEDKQTTLQEIVASQSESWYKTQVLELLISINQTLLRIEEEGKK